MASNCDTRHPPRFSVVIPTYNRAECLSRTIRSVLNQTFGDFEVLVMDDGSTDRTREVVEGFHDPRVIYSWAANSGGPATPRNRGLSVAMAAWVCFLDADDIWYPSKLEEIDKAIMTSPSTDAVCNNEHLVIRGRTTKTLTYGPFKQDFYRVMLAEGNLCSTSAMTVRRAFLTDHKLKFNPTPDYVIVEDYDLWLRMAKLGARFTFVDLVLGGYVVEDDSISLNEEKHLRNTEALLRDHISAIPADDPGRDLLRRRISVMLNVARAKRLVRTNNLKAAVNLAVATVVQSPSASGRYVLARILHRLRRITLWSRIQSSRPS